ncbi:hypothetical protein H8E07_07865 [bacterium]|nr:hypothetical protein [bacterium]
MVNRYRLIVSTFCILVLSATPAAAYMLLLDIDTDGDPGTINELTYETSAIVDLILVPSYPDEPIGRVEFGLGGSCRECDMVHHYGTAQNLITSEQMWIQAAAFESGWDGALTLGCIDNPGFHLLLWCQPVGGGTVYMTDAVVIAEFEAWVAAPVPPGCSQPPSNLAVMPSQGAYWNYIQLGGPAIPNEAASWSAIKAMYR